MAAYFAMRIEQGMLDYKAVIERYPKYKDDIVDILVADGYTVNEDGAVTKL